MSYQFHIYTSQFFDTGKHYTGYLIFENGTIQVEELYQQTDKKFIVQNRSHGEYYLLPSSGRLELFDSDGDLKEIGYTASKIEFYREQIGTFGKSNKAEIDSLFKR